MAEDKRIYELDTAVDTQGKIIMLDSAGSGDATFTPVPYHMVTTLPVSPIPLCVYYLTEVDGTAPIGLYTHNNGWICKTCFETLTLPDANGMINYNLYTGASYVVNIVGEISGIDINLSSDGLCRILLKNPSAFTVGEPYGGYRTTEFAFDALNAESVRFTVQRDTINGTTSNEYASVERVLFGPQSTVLGLVAGSGPYIDTGMYTAADNYVKIVGSVTDQWDTLCGAFGEDGIFSIGGANGSGIVYAFWMDAGRQISATPIVGSAVYEVFANGDIALNGTVETTATQTGSLNNTTTLFAFNGEYGMQYNSGVTIIEEYYAENSSGTPLIHLFPVESGTSYASGGPVATENCMWDTVSETFFTNDGSGAFIVVEV